MNLKLRPTSFIHPPAILAIGSSTGGLQALAKLFEGLKGAQIDIPIVITQHIPENFDDHFSDQIEESSGRKCVVATDGEKLEPGVIYFAPSERHMTIGKRGEDKVALIDNSAPVNFCKPAVDPLFKSVAKVYGKKVTAIVLTGIGSDGFEGAKGIVEAGGTVIAQDEISIVVWGMPGAVAKGGLCTAVLPLDEIAAFLIEHSYGKIR